MVNTRYGSKVERVIRLDFQTGDADFIRENDGGRIFKGYIADLVADGGLKEIEEAAETIIQ